MSGNNANINSANIPASAKTFAWRIAYDSRNRIASFDRTAPGSAQSRYSWDANSNGSSLGSHLWGQVSILFA